jgi:hypothetical protein
MDNSQNPINGIPDNNAEEGVIEIERNRLAFAMMDENSKRDFILTYQQPRQDQIPKFMAIRVAIEAAYKAVEDNCPPCADRSHTLRLLRDARMWANAAIALDGVV